MGAMTKSFHNAFLRGGGVEIHLRWTVGLFGFQINYFLISKVLVD